MKLDTLEFLRCPTCGGELSWSGSVEHERLVTGSLGCRQCGRVYPIRAGIPRFVEPQELTGLNRRYETLYNLISRMYDSDFLLARRVRRQFWPAGEEQARQEVVGRLEVGGAARVLETAIGSGANVPYVWRQAPEADVHGVDISVGMLRQGVRRLNQREAEVGLYLAAAEALPFANDSFDAVFHLGAINYFSNQKRAVDEMIRVARPGTRLIIADETEEVSEGPLARAATRLFFGRRLTEKIYSFRPEDLRALIPPAMRDVRFESIWEGNGYRLEFTKP